MLKFFNKDDVLCLNLKSYLRNDISIIYLNLSAYFDNIINNFKT